MDTSNNFVVLNQYTLTSRYLTPMIFNKDALASLSVFGLMNVYLDDYGSSKKYDNCLFFLFAVSDDLEFNKLQKTIANFNSFYDYYDINEGGQELRMFVFKVHNIYERDLFSFKHNRMDELSESFLKLLDNDVDFTNLIVNLPGEIYRFRLELNPNS
jgi:hypothetical protein